MSTLRVVGALGQEQLRDREGEVAGGVPVAHNATVTPFLTQRRPLKALLS